MITSFCKVALIWIACAAFALSQGSQLPRYTVATLPAASMQPNYIVQVIDGASSTDCVVGGGAQNVVCISNGTSWTAQGSIARGGTGATTAAGALTNLGAQVNLGATQTGAIGASGTATFPGNVAATSVNSSVNSVINVKAAPYNAVGNGSTDDTVAIKAALAAAVAAHTTMCFPAGTYLVSSPLQADPTLTNGSAVSNFGIAACGAGQWGYDAATAPVVIEASSSWNTSGGNTSVLDLRYSSNVHLKDFSVNANSVTSLDGIEFGDRDISANYGNFQIDNVSSFGANRAWLFQDAGLLRAKNIQGSGSNYGFYANYFGDADIDGSYFNTNATNHIMSTSGDAVGSGIFLLNSGNTNIRGGKIEWNANGIFLYNAQGINIDGINFDWNTTHHILVVGTLAIGNPYATTSLNFSHNRFLSGGINSDGFGNKTAITFYTDWSSTADIFATLTGNSFRTACDLAYDECTTGSVGPVNDFIQIFNPVVGANITVTASGNDFKNMVGTTTSTAAVYGPGTAILNWGMNTSNLPFDTESGGIEQSAFPSVNVSGLSTYSGNVLFGPGTGSGNSQPEILSTNGYDTATTPSYTWWWDSLTGIYHPAVGQVGVAAPAEFYVNSPSAIFSGTVAAGTAMFGNQVLSVPSGGSMRNPVQTDDAAHGATLNNPYWINQSTQDTYQLLDATTGQASWARLVPNYALPVDLIGSSIQGAYSVYKIRSAYAGNAMTIERASDSTTQALTFVNGYVDVVTATKFCLGTTCSVATWNDQSGNGYDCTQSTLANMPVFLIDTLGKGVTISFDGVNTQQYCNLPSGLAIANANLTMLVVAMPTSLANPEMEMFLNLGPVTGKETNLTLRQGLVSGITYNPPAVVFSDPWGIHGTTPADTGPAIYAAEQNSSTVTTWLNEHSTTATPTGNNQALTGGQIGTDLVYNTRYSGTISTVMIGNAALTAAQRTAAFNSLYKLHGISPQYEMNNWVALGDSTTAGTGTTGSDGWANLLQKQLTTRLLNDGIGGEWCATINTNFATVNAPMFDPAARNNVLTLLCGIHDSGVGLAPAVYTLIQSIVSQARAAGFTVAVGTLFDLNSESAYRLALNSLIRSGAAAGNYTVCDFGASAVMGQPGQNTNLAYFNSDQTHPTALGYAVMAQIARGCVEPLLER